MNYFKLFILITSIHLFTCVYSLHCRTSEECKLYGYIMCTNVGIFHNGHCLGCLKNTCIDQIELSSSYIYKPISWIFLFSIFFI